MANFGNLYNYSINGGIVMPDTSLLKASVQNAFLQIFGTDFNTDPETANGRLIEALTFFFRDVLGVNAQNLTSFNVNRAVGLYLDNLGNAFGVTRDFENNESDFSYRKRIVDSFSRGSGFASSVSNAIIAAGASRCTVLDNGNPDPQNLPRSVTGEVFAHSVNVLPHSILVFAVGGADDAVAKAIAETKACGCGIDHQYAGYIEKQVEIDGVVHTVYFYRPSSVAVTLSVVVSDMAYLGIDIEKDAKDAILDLFSAKSTCATITPEDVSAALASNGRGIILKACQFTEAGNTVSELVFTPFEIASISVDDITVTVQ